MIEHDLLQAGIAAYLAGDTKQATALFAQVVRANPNSEDGWLWLGLAREVPEQRIYCFQRVLAINPNNARARELLEPPLPAIPPESHSTPPPDEAEQPSEFHESAVRQETPVSSDPGLDRSVSDLRAGSPQSSAPVFDAKDEKPDGGRKFLIAAAGFLVAILLCGSGLAYLIKSNQMDYLIGQLSGSVKSAPQTAGTPVALTTAELATPSPAASTATLTPTQAPSPASTVTLSFASRSAKAEFSVSMAQSLMKEEKYAEAITSWDKVLELVPENAEAHYQRALCYFKLLDNQRFLDEYVDYLRHALEDMDQAIALNPSIGDYYKLRSDIYERLAIVTPYRVDSVNLETIALENLETSSQLGNSVPNPERLPALSLISSGKCEEGLRLVNQLVEESGPSAPASSGLNYLLARGNLCLGRLDQALKYINLAIQSRSVFDLTWVKLLTLYSMGRLDEALTILNDSITNYPYY